MKQLRSVIFTCLLAGTLSLAGCSVKSEQKLLKYASAQYGSNTLLSQENNNGSRKLTLQDEQYGFTYHIISSLDAVSIDGSDLFRSESTSSDFDECYYQYFVQTHSEELSEIADTCHAAFSPGVSYDGSSLVRVDADSAEHALEAANSMGALLAAFDTRHYWDGRRLDCECGSEEHIGSILLPDLHRQSPADEKAAFYQKTARQYASNAEFVRAEQLTFGETGFPADRVLRDVTTPVPNPEDLVVYYWFRSGSKEFFIANFSDTETHSFYTNAKEVLK